MAIPFIPESAPFNVEQRAWLNGFFAGVFGLQANGHATPATAVAAKSVTKEESFPWHDSSLPLLDRMKLAEGRSLERRLMAAMAQLNCGACGYLCQTYSEAIARGEEADLTKCSPGGSETAKALKMLLAEGKTNDKGNGNGHTATASTVPSAAAESAKPGTSRARPFAARLLRSIRLTHPDSPKDTRHVEIDLLESGLNYEAGDSLGILPLNSPELVDQVLQSLGRDGTESVLVSERPLREVLTSDVALARVRPPLVELLAGNLPANAATALRQELEQDSDALCSKDVAELLQRFPESAARLPVPSLLDSLAKLQPRLYSISSSLKAHPGEVHLTVGVVRFESAGRWRNGVASHFLGVRSQPGDEVRTFIQSSRFRLPEDPATPIIMVGPGTGIAPFRAFLEERQAVAAAGRNWLFFGNQYAEFDYLYREQLEAWRNDGHLARLELAFSRDRATKVYVQHRMLEHGAELWQWIQNGAHFYVCGDAKRMAPDVDRALRQVAESHGRLSDDGAKEFVADLIRAKRYQKDVY